MLGQIYFRYDYKSFLLKVKYVIKNMAKHILNLLIQISHGFD